MNTVAAPTNRVPSDFVFSSDEVFPTTVRRTVRLRDSQVEIPAGTPAAVRFGKLRDQAWMHITANDEVFISRRFTSFFEPPTDSELAAAVSECVCPSITGENVEPDGEDEHGAPSWLSALGMI